MRFVLSCLRACGLTLAAGAFGLPMVLLLAASTHAPGSVPVPGDIWPDSPGIAAYFTAFEQVPMARALLNSVVLLLLFVPTALVTGSLGGFGIRLMSPRWQLIAIALLVAAASVPYAAIWLPRFMLFQWLGLGGSWIPLWAPALMGGHPLLVLLFYVSARGILSSQIDAARLESAGWLRIWWRVALPQMQPALLAAALLATAWCWSSFTEPLLYLHSERSQTAPLMLYALELLGASNWSVLMAAAIVLAAPVVLILLVVPRILNRSVGG